MSINLHTVKQYTHTHTRYTVGPPVERSGVKGRREEWPRPVWCYNSIRILIRIITLLNVHNTTNIMRFVL